MELSRKSIPKENDAMCAWKIETADTSTGDYIARVHFPEHELMSSKNHDRKYNKSIHLHNYTLLHATYIPTCTQDTINSHHPSLLVIPSLQPSVPTHIAITG
jgi:hypothetical protein